MFQLSQLPTTPELLVGSELSVSVLVHGSFWNLETAHFGTWLILEPRRKENSPGLQRETNFAAHFGTRIIR